jgi:hypothetical protein
MKYNAHELFCLVCLILLLTPQPKWVFALDPGEITALADMQAEWGSQLGWTGAPSCSWKRVTCDSNGNVIYLYVFLFFSVCLFDSTRLPREEKTQLPPVCN